MAFVRMSGDRLCARIAECICEKVRAHESRTLTVVIDGKAAAGKTYLADYLAERLAKQGVNVCRIEADWFLESRTVREKKEQEGRREVSGHNYFPANLHFSYWKWEALREAIRKAREVAAPPGGGTFVLTGLYDRSTGECTREATIEVTPPRVLIVEGCYLLAQDLAPDVSILLYVNREIGRARKIQREEKKKEGEFPNVERVGVVITSWEQLEEPTFFWYLMEHGCKADVVVDTSDTESMSVVKFALGGQQEDELQRALRWDQRVKAAEERRNVEELLALAREAPAGGDYIRVMLLAGRLARGRLQFDVALNAFSEVLAKASGSWEAMTQKALMLERLNRIDEAQRVLETASSMLKAYVAPDPRGCGGRPAQEPTGLLGQNHVGELGRHRWLGQGSDRPLSACSYGMPARCLCGRLRGAAAGDVPGVGLSHGDLRGGPYHPERAPLTGRGVEKRHLTHNGVGRPGRSQCELPLGPKSTRNCSKVPDNEWKGRDYVGRPAVADCRRRSSSSSAARSTLAVQSRSSGATTTTWKPCCSPSIRTPSESSTCRSIPKAAGFLLGGRSCEDRRRCQSWTSWLTIPST
jgi:uridine kinase